MPPSPLGGLFFAVLAVAFGRHGFSGVGALEMVTYLAGTALSAFMATITAFGWKEPKWLSSELTEAELAARERSRWVDQSWAALKTHAGWRDDYSAQSMRHAERLRAWVSQQPTMPLEHLLARYDEECGTDGPKSEPRPRGGLQAAKAWVRKEFLWRE